MFCYLIIKFFFKELYPYTFFWDLFVQRNKPLSIQHELNTNVDLIYLGLLHDWCNKGQGMCCPVCGMMHIKEPFLLIDKSGPCSGGSGFSL